MLLLMNRSKEILPQFVLWKMRLIKIEQLNSKPEAGGCQLQKKMIDMKNQMQFEELIIIYSVPKLLILWVVFCGNINF